MQTIAEEQENSLNQSNSVINHTYDLGLLSEQETRKAMAEVDFSEIFQQVLQMFDINYYVVDCDSDLMLKKLEYVFTRMPPINDKQREIEFEINCIKTANGKFMDFIRCSTNKFDDMEVSPLENEDPYYAVPQEFRDILEETRKYMRELMMEQQSGAQH